MSCFSFYLFSFSSYKIKEQEGRRSPAQRGGLTPSGVEVELWGKGGRRRSTVKKMHTDVSKCKNDTC
jgi:hypothetical protein